MNLKSCRSLRGGSCRPIIGKRACKRDSRITSFKIARARVPGYTSGRQGETHTVIRCVRIVRALAHLVPNPIRAPFRHTPSGRTRVIDGLHICPKFILTPCIQPIVSGAEIARDESSRIGDSKVNRTVSVGSQLFELTRGSHRCAIYGRHPHERILASPLIEKAVRGHSLVR